MQIYLTFAGLAGPVTIAAGRYWRSFAIAAISWLTGIGVKTNVG